MRGRNLADAAEDRAGVAGVGNVNLGPADPCADRRRARKGGIDLLRGKAICWTSFGVEGAGGRGGLVELQGLASGEVQLHCEE